MGNLGPWEILIIAGVIILLFGARKMPEMARSLGKSARILKAETKGMRGEEGEEKAIDKAAEPAKPQDTEVELLRKQVAAAEARAQAVEKQPQTPQVAPPIEQTQANKNVG